MFKNMVKKFSNTVKTFKNTMKMFQCTVRIFIYMVKTFNNTMYTVMFDINNMTLNKVTNYMISWLRKLTILTPCSKG